MSGHGIAFSHTGMLRTIRRQTAAGAFLTGLLMVASACAIPAATLTPAPTVTPPATATPTPAPPPSLTVSVVYPTSTSDLEMGQAIRFTGRAEDAQSAPAADAQVTVTARGPNGAVVASLPAQTDDQGLFRTESWMIPRRSTEGTWTAAAEASASQSRGSGKGAFKVRYSTSEVLLNKYGFWLDAPVLAGARPDLFAEKGDARNGRILWGAARPAQHVIGERWIQVDWLEGNAGLTDPEAVRRFMLADVGELGLTPVRAIGPIEPVTFGGHDAWHVQGRGQFRQDQVEWVAFFAPEANKTVLLGTRVVVPSSGIDAHAQLRDGFAFIPEVLASGTAPQPLPRLLPGPELLSPALGAQFAGLDLPVIVSWRSTRPLAPDEFYLVEVDYNHGETNSLVSLTTRESQLELPASLYETPNCQVFNWQVTLMRRTRADQAGRPIGEPLSYRSLYGYLEWRHPAGQAPFNTGCPNEQF